MTACSLEVSITLADDLRSDSGAEAVTYQTDIRPILAARCYKCHGETVQRGNLRLDEHAFAAMGGDSKLPILAPSAVSELYRRINSGDPMERMPLGGATVSPDEIKLIKRWLDEGAHWPAVGKINPGATKFWRLVDRGTAVFEAFYGTHGWLAPPFVALLLLILVFERGKRYFANPPAWAGARAKWFFAFCNRTSAGWYVACVLVLVAAGAAKFATDVVDERDHWMAIVSDHQRQPVAPGSEAGRPRPFRPRHPRRVGGIYYRGNDERNSALFNGGYYRTATFLLSLVDANGREIKAGDAVPIGRLAIRLEIRRAPATVPRLFAEDIMNRASLCVRTVPDPEGKQLPVRFTVLEPGERWAAEYPIGQVDGTAELRLAGIVYVFDNSVPHYGIEYDLHLLDGQLQNDSELWMGAIALTGAVRIPEEGTIPLSEWFDFREIPEIEGANSTDEVLLGVPEHVGPEHSGKDSPPAVPNTSPSAGPTSAPLEP